MNWTNLLITFADRLPALIQLGIDVSSDIATIRAGVDSLASGNAITAAQRAVLDAKMAEAELAWAVQVAKAKAELADDAGNG